MLEGFRVPGVCPIAPDFEKDPSWDVVFWFWVEALRLAILSGA